MKSDCSTQVQFVGEEAVDTGGGPPGNFGDSSSRALLCWGFWDVPEHTRIGSKCEWHVKEMLQSST